MDIQVSRASVTCPCANESQLSEAYYGIGASANQGISLHIIRMNYISSLLCPYDKKGM